MEYCLKAVCHAPQSVKICVVWKTLQYLTFLEKNIKKKKKKDKTTTPKPTALYKNSEGKNRISKKVKSIAIFY